MGVCRGLAVEYRGMMGVCRGLAVEYRGMMGVCRGQRLAWGVLPKDDWVRPDEDWWDAGQRRANEDALPDGSALLAALPPVNLDDSSTAID